MAAFKVLAKAKSNVVGGTITGISSGSWSSPPIVSAVSSLFAKSSGVPSSPGVLSTSVGGVLFGSVSSSASLISESFVSEVPVKDGSIWNVIGTTVLAATGITGMFVFKVAVVPTNVQSVSTRIKPAGTSSVKPTLNADVLP